MEKGNAPLVMNMDTEEFERMELSYFLSEDGKSGKIVKGSLNKPKKVDHYG